MRYVDIGVELGVRDVGGKFVRWSVCKFIKKSALPGTVYKRVWERGVVVGACGYRYIGPTFEFVQEHF